MREGTNQEIDDLFDEEEDYVECPCGKQIDPKNHVVLQGEKYCLDCFESFKTEPLDYYNDRRAC